MSESYTNLYIKSVMDYYSIPKNEIQKFKVFISKSRKTQLDALSQTNLTIK